MTVISPAFPDPERSIARQFAAATLPAPVRTTAGALVALLLLWPLLFLVPDAFSSGWSDGLLSAAWFSVSRAAIGVGAGVALAIPLGAILARYAVPARRLIRALLTVPVVLPAFAIALGVGWGLEQGWLRLLVAQGALGLAVGVRLGGGAWHEVPPERDETARSFGLNAMGMVRRYYLPVLGGPFLAAFALAFALALGSFGTATLLAPVGSPALVELAGGPTSAEAARAASAGLLLAALGAGALVVFLRFRPADGKPAREPGYEPLGALEPGQRAGAWGLIGLGLLVALGPWVALVHGTFTIGATEQVTGENVSALFADSRLLAVGPLSSLRHTAVLAGSVLIVALPVGFVVAMVVAPLRGWSATAVEAALLLPLVVAVPLAAGLRAAGLGSSSWLLFVQVGMGVALVVRAMLPVARARVRRQIDAAIVLGASRWYAWRRLVSPVLRAQLAVAGVLVVAWSAGELGAALLLQRIDVAPASVAVVGALERQTDGGDGLAFALSGLLALLIGLLFVTIEYRRSREITEF